MSDVILLISDNAGTDRDLRLALTSSAPECQVEFVGNREQIKAARRPKVILLDLMLSCEPAFDVLRWLKTEQGYKQIPVFALGSETVTHEANEAYALGANSCLLLKSAREGFERIAQGIAAYASLIPN